MKARLAKLATTALMSATVLGLAGCVPQSPVVNVHPVVHGVSVEVHSYLDDSTKVESVLVTVRVRRTDGSIIFMPRSQEVPVTGTDSALTVHFHYADVTTTGQWRVIVTQEINWAPGETPQEYKPARISARFSIGRGGAFSFEGDEEAQ